MLLTSLTAKIVVAINSVSGMSVGGPCFTPRLFCRARMQVVFLYFPSQEFLLYLTLIRKIIIEDASGDALPPPSFGEDPTHEVVPLRKAME